MAYKDPEKNKEYQKTYSEKYHKEHKKEKRAYAKKYYEEHREWLLKLDKKYREEHREKIKAKSRKYYKVRRQRALALFGNMCLFCGERQKNLLFHKKDGLPHSNHTVDLVLKNPKEWVLLCFLCHKGVHWNMRYLGMFWDEIMVRLPLKGNNNG